MTSSTDCDSSCTCSPQFSCLLFLELDRNSLVPRKYADFARQILADCGAVIDCVRLRLVVKAALEVQTLFFTAALHEPSQSELHDLFEDFLLLCIASRGPKESR
jgi:hypothetical protein